MFRAILHGLGAGGGASASSGGAQGGGLGSSKHQAGSASALDLSKSPLDPGLMLSAAGNTRSPSSQQGPMAQRPKDAFRAIMSQFHQANRTDEERMRNLTPVLAKIVDILADSTAREVVESSTCASDVRMLIGLTTKALHGSFSCEKSTGPTQADILGAVEHRVMIRLQLRVLELFLLPEHAIAHSHACDDAQRLLWVLSRVGKQEVEQISGPEAWETAEDDFRCMSKSIGEILRTLSRRERTAKEVDVGLLFNVLLIQVSESSDDSSVWIQCARNAIAALCHSDAFDIEMCGWIKMSDHIKTGIELIQTATALGKIRTAAIVFSAFAFVLKESYRHCLVLIDEFQELGGYEAVARLLLVSAASERPEIENVILRSLESLAYIGPVDEESAMLAEIETPFQHADFRHPIAGPSLLLRNYAVMDVLRDVVTATAATSAELGMCPLPAQLARIRQSAANVLHDIIKANPVNYFIASRSTVLLKSVEHLDSIDLQSQAIILDILRYVILELNYVPFKELALLFVHLQGGPSLATIESCSHFCVRLLDDSRRFKDVFRELGLLGMFSGLLCELYKHFAGATDVDIKDSPSSFDSQAFVVGDSLVSGFFSIMGILRRLLQSPENMQIFRSRSRERLFDLIGFKPLRSGVFLIVETLSRDDPSLKFDILNVVNKAVKASTYSQHAFRTSGGFEAMAAALATLKRGFEQFDEVVPLKDILQAAESYGHTVVSERELLRLWFETVCAAVQGCPQSRAQLGSVARTDAMLQALHSAYIVPDSHVALVFGGLFAITFELPDFLDFFETSITHDMTTRELKDTLFMRFSAGKVPMIRNARCLVVAAKLLPSVSRMQSTLVHAILGSLQATAAACKHNQVSLCSSGILEIAFGWLFERSLCWFIRDAPSGSSLSLLDNASIDQEPDLFMKRCEGLLMSIAKRLIEIGIADSELQYLLSCIDIKTKLLASEQQTMLFEFLLHGLRYGRAPHYLHFDGVTSMTPGYLMLPDYNRSFPPAVGYTFMAWVRVEKFDPSANTTILSIIDSDNKERLTVFFEGAQSKHLVAQTIKTTCRFNAMTLHEREWTHICLVHQKPRISASTIELYINGVHVESAKCGYLGHPGSAAKVQTYIGNLPETHRGETSGSRTVWDLGPTYFIEEALLSAADIAVIYETRFDSTGNWRAYTSRYQSAEKKEQRPVAQLEEEISPLASISFVLAPSKTAPDTLDISEDKILFSLCAGNALEKIVETHAEETYSVLSAVAMRLQASTNAVLNSAFVKPSFEPESEPECAYVKGDVLVVCQNRMIDGIWKLGGCAVLLKLIEISTTSEALYQSVSVLVESLEHSWRNEAEMEKCHFFEILSYLIKGKRDLVTIAIMDVLLILVGRTLEHSDNATLKNHHAMRHLFLDIELWRTSPELQRYYLTQMTDFIVHSSNRDQNIQKLNKMAMIKRMLLMLKSQIIPTDLLPEIINHLKIFLKAGWSTDTIKSVCSFLMSTLPKDDDFSEVRDMTAKLKTVGGRRRLEDMPVLVPNAKAMQQQSYVVQMRNAILEMLFEVLSERSDSQGSFDTEFVRVVTSRWVVLFCGPRLDSYTVVLATRIFARLWIAHDISSPSKFREGFMVMSRLLQPYYNALQLYPSLLAILCGIDVSSVPSDMSFDVSTLMAVMKPLGTKARRNISPDVMRVITSLLIQTVRTLSKWSDTIEAVNQEIKAEIRLKGTSHDDGNGSGDSIDKAGRPRFPDAELDKSRAKLDALSEAVQTILQFIGTMYRYLEDMKDSVCRQESIDDFVSLLFQLISTGNPVSIEKELTTKGEMPEAEELTVASMFKNAGESDQNEEALKLKLKFVQIEAPETAVTAYEQPSAAAYGSKSSLGGKTGSVAALDGNKGQTQVGSNPALRGESMFSLAGRSAANISEQGSVRGREKSAAQATASKTRSMFALCNTSPDNLSITKRNLIDSLIELIMTITVESILGTWKPMQGLEMVLKAIPPSTKKAQVYFQSFILSCTMNAVHAKLNKRKSYLSDTRVLATVGKFITMLVDKAYQGVFVDGPETVYDFVLAVVDIIQSIEDENSSKVLRTDFSQMPSFHKQVNRITAFYFGVCASNPETAGRSLVPLLDRILFYHKIILSSKNSDSESFKILAHHLFVCLQDEREPIQRLAMAVWKLLLLQKPAQVSMLLRSPKAGADYKELVDGISKILEMDASFSEWLASKKEEITAVFNENATKVWDQSCAAELRAAKDGIKASGKSRYSKLKKQYKRMGLESEIFVKYLARAKTWTHDVQKMELARFQRFRQDYQLMISSIDADWMALSGSLERERAIWGPEAEKHIRWKLDFTEARARMRKKMRRNNDAVVHYQSKFEKIQLSSKAPKAPEAASPLGGSFEVNAESSAAPKTEDQAVVSAGDRLADIETAHTLQLSDDRQPSPTSPAFPSGADVQNALSPLEPEAESAEAEEQAEEDLAAATKPDLRIQLSTDNLNADKDGTEAEADWEEVTADEDQNRKILRLLEPGDEVVDIVNCARLVGLELCEGLCILCQDNVYIIDNYFQRADGEIVDIDDVPREERNIYHAIVLGSKKHEQQRSADKTVDDERHMCRKFPFEDIKEVHKRLYLFRNVALEIFIGDGRNSLLSFWTTRARDAVYSRMLSKASLNTDESVSGISPASGQSVLQNVIFGGSPLAELTQKWCSREISNFAYLMHLNTLAGRSYNDLTQYPVFPWILADYESSTIDLNNPAVYRDLSKPMGAQGPTRAAEFIERFAAWDDPSTPGCHYGTHYSSSMIVCSYLIRLEPFTQQYLKLQGGHFDHPDRLFHSIALSWASASRLNTTDVRELIPEFFYLPDFLVNGNKFEFGVKQTGEVINDVFLPPWAKGDANLFIQTNREALESEYVSAHLHEWIDLIFGFKQQGEEAAKAVNVFHYLSYEGAVDIDRIEDPVEKQATISIIHNFGQTPRQLFRKPHPRRGTDGSENQYKIHRNPEMLIQAAAPIKGKFIASAPVSDIMLSSAADKIMVVGSCKLFVPPACSRYIEWDFLDNSLRLCQADTGKTICVFENLHIGHGSCAAFASQSILVTGGSDAAVCVWRLTSSRHPDISLVSCMRGHRKKVISLAVSSSYSIIVSGGEDGVAILWDLNRSQYVRTLCGHDAPVTAVAVHEGTGDIITCSATQLRFWDVNGNLMFSKTVSGTVSDAVLSVAFYEIWTRSYVDQPWAADAPLHPFKWDIKCIKMLEPHTSPSPVTLIQYSSGRFLVTGDMLGRVTSWMLPDGSGTELHFAHEDACMTCSTKFTVLERKGNCRCCGGSFCSQCMASLSDRGYRMCHTCFGKSLALQRRTNRSSRGQTPTDSEDTSLTAPDGSDPAGAPPAAAPPAGAGAAGAGDGADGRDGGKPARHGDDADGDVDPSEDPASKSVSAVPADPDADADAATGSRKRPAAGSESVVRGRPVRRAGSSVEKSKSSSDESSSAVDRITVPEVYPQLLAIPLTRRPLFPGFYKSLYIKDPKAIKAIQSLVERRQPYVGIFLAKDDNADSDLVTDVDQIHKTGVFAQITNTYFSGPDNSALTVVVYPHRRIRASDLVLPPPAPLPDADPAETRAATDAAMLKYLPISLPMVEHDVPLINVENLADEPYNAENRLIKAITSEIINVLKEISQLNPLLRDQIISISVQTGNLLLDPSKLADFAAAVSSGEPNELQSILESLVVEERLHKALVVLKKELANAKLQQEISREVDRKMTRKQQEYFLMEQLKGIKKELGMESDGKEKLVEKFREKASKLTMPDAIKKVFDEELNKLQHLEPAASEFNVTRNYLDWLTQIPWGQRSAENFDVAHARTVLDEDHYGLKDVKERILEFIAVGKLRGTVEGKIITMVGPPGVGKTSVGKSIARALGREFYRFSVGGLTDVAEIKGHRRTYVGAMPGKIVQALKKVQTENPLIMIDEIDKLGKSHQGDPASALLELLDPEQNSSFLDHYLDVPLDLSKVLFVCTANTLDTIPAPLLDRMEVITLSGYVAEEKVAISSTYLEPTSRVANGLENHKVTLTKEAIETLIRQYCRESGVRNLKKHIDKIFRKAAFRIVSGGAPADTTNATPAADATPAAQGTPGEIVITPENLRDYVGSPVYTSDRMYEETPAGVVMGLAWTQMGGSSLYIESVLESAITGDSKPHFHRTGQMGDVMKESATIAYTYARALFAKRFPENKFFDHASIHMHVPEGATPKDGPSAGSTMTTSLLSLALRKPVIPDVAMTGEITLTGKILRIGGVKEKAIAAKRSGVKTIIFPHANKSDWDELPDYIKEGLEPHFVKWYEEIFAIVFPDA
ncbi:Beige protein-like 1 [Polyrhizophydium stewartii]|uniref:Lon protease homolog, mitochondrial n=1 Tax=Polyrhizophydium stewartii TaxID=2732419 RepID=A0ABR4NF86_9FUNG